MSVVPARRWRLSASFLLPTLALAFGLSGCGGGGGGSPEPLTFSPVTPARVTAVVPQGAAPVSVELSSTVGGDVTQLVGRTIFVRLQGGDGLYEPTAFVSYEENTRVARLVIAGVAQDSVGERSARLSIQVCEDTACQRPLTTSPLSVDVTVRVTAGMRVTQDAVSVSAPFGTLPATAQVGVTTPEGTAPQDFRVDLRSLSPGLLDPPFVVSFSTDAANPGVVIAPRLLREGRYEAVLQVESTAYAGADNAFTYVSEIPLVLEVTPSSAEFAVLPEAVAIEIPVGDPFVRFFDVATVAREGGFVLRGIDFDDSRNPPGAAGSPLLGQWLRAENGRYVVGGCTNDTICLPAGSYHGSLRFERFSDGFATGQVVTVPVTMTLR